MCVSNTYSLSAEYRLTFPPIRTWACIFASFSWFMITPAEWGEENTLTNVLSISRELACCCCCCCRRCRQTLAQQHQALTLKFTGKRISGTSKQANHITVKAEMRRRDVAVIKCSDRQLYICVRVYGVCLCVCAVPLCGCTNENTTRERARTRLTACHGSVIHRQP